MAPRRPELVFQDNQDQDNNNYNHYNFGVRNHRQVDVNGNNDRVQINQEENTQDEPEAWIFGYGSLCWFPGFEFEKCITGYIRGYVRRFWQGNVTHRGTKERPGVVATLTEEHGGLTWGCAYKVTGSLALEYLNQRECKLGGYITEELSFYPRVASEHSVFNGEAFPVLVYIATPDNDYWMGDRSLVDLAQDIAECRGPSGYNVEYLVRLAMFMRDELPDAEDEHLFELERLCLEYMNAKNLNLEERMGAPRPRIPRDSHESEVRETRTFAFTSRVPARQLRCLQL